MFIQCCLLVALCSQCVFGWKGTESPEESWTGRWFPERQPSSTPPPRLLAEKVSDGDNTREMGVKDVCDDGKTLLKVDHPSDHSAYVCMTPRNRIRPNFDIPPKMEYEDIPPAYSAEHRCMNESISYSSSIPTFGPHRQLWPVYGEYKFLPVQRWIHTLEHGGIVALYHPCADLRSIAMLRKAVRSCLRRHVITPSAALDRDRPFALVAWGVRLRMPWVGPSTVRQFIQSHALLGPEKVSRDGQYRDLLLHPADIVTDVDDSQLCPQPLAHD